MIAILILAAGAGVRVEGVLRQAADVDEVYRRVREYEQGLFNDTLVSEAKTYHISQEES